MVSANHSDHVGAAMEADFWHDRWRSNRIGFHQQDFNRHLLKHWPGLGTETEARVFVPLCGKSRDLIWLAERGHAVVGCEISEIAVESFFKEAGLTPRIAVDGPVQRWSAGSIEILLGDFFGLTRELIGEVDLVYDRASLIAFPEPMRPAYVEALAGLVPPGTRMLLLTLDYPQDEMEGPPFSVPEPEIRDLFEGLADVELLESETEAFGDFPQFRGRQLSRLAEKIYRLHTI
jgi:thiopurine S-methyltransferase